MADPGPASLPRVMVGAGCAGTGPELDRLGELALLPAAVVGPVVAVGDPWSGWACPRPVDGAPVLRPVPGGLVHLPAGPLSTAVLTAEVLPWWAARGLRLWVNVRASSAGALAEVLTALCRSDHVAVVAGVELDLTAPGVPDDQVAVGGPPERRRGAHSADPDRCRRLASRARELLPRGLPLLAKLGLESPDPLPAARAAVAGGASGLVLAGSVPVDPLPSGAGLVEDGSGTRLAGPAVLPLTESLVRRVHTAVLRGRVPVVPLVAAGGVHDTASARALLEAGAVGVQLGTAVLGEPELPWRLAAELAAAESHGPAPPAAGPAGTSPDPNERTSS